MYLKYSFSSQRRREWILTSGFPFFDEPVAIIKSTGIILPSETLILNHKYGIFLTLSLHSTADPKAIANLISDLMFRLQGITDGTSIEVALEND